MNWNWLISLIRAGCADHAGEISHLSPDRPSAYAGDQRGILSLRAILRDCHLLPFLTNPRGYRAASRCLKHPSADASNSRQKDYLDKFLYITNYINEHFAEDLSLEQIADLAGFSKYHFTRLFKQYTDTSFYKYLNQKRIDYAKTLLLDPNLPVLDVALQCGFSSLSAFLRMFKQLNMCTPTESGICTIRRPLGTGKSGFFLFFLNCIINLRSSDSFSLSFSCLIS